MASNGVFHLFNKSIAEFEIFKDRKNLERFLWMVRFFSIPKNTLSFSNFIRDFDEGDRKLKIALMAEQFPRKVRLISYCLMPTHFHFIVEQKEKDAISQFMHKLLDSYTKFFNFKHHRKGPLWEGRFKHVLCETDEQLLHLTRYIHLNPVTAYLVDKPEEWFASSYKEYLNMQEDPICNWDGLLEIKADPYKKFTNSRIEDQRILAKIQKLLLD